MFVTIGARVRHSDMIKPKSNFHNIKFSSCIQYTKAVHYMEKWFAENFTARIFGILSIKFIINDLSTLNIKYIIYTT